MGNKFFTQIIRLMRWVIRVASNPMTDSLYKEGNQNTDMNRAKIAM